MILTLNGRHLLNPADYLLSSTETDGDTDLVSVWAWKPGLANPVLVAASIKPGEAVRLLEAIGRAGGGFLDVEDALSRIQQEGAQEAFKARSQARSQMLGATVDYV